MRLLRFMHPVEFAAYSTGQTLHDSTNWKKHGNNSTSIGFCWFPYDDEDPERRLRYMPTIFQGMRAVVVDTDEPMRIGEGIYRDPDKDDALLNQQIAAGDFTMWGYLLNMSQVPKMKRTEYSCTEYDKKRFKLVKTGIVFLDRTRTEGYWSIAWDKTGGGACNI